MKRSLCVLAVLATAVAAPAMAADVAVSVQIGDPRFYGRIDIGNFPQPQLVYPKPVVIHPAPVRVAEPPLYLRVPPGHAKHWSKHCHKYDACGHPVYFVQDRWYQEVYVPHYRESHGAGHEHAKGKGKGKGHRDD